MRKLNFLLLVLSTLALQLLACTPKPAPTPMPIASVAVVPSPSPTLATGIKASPNPEEAAWAGVIAGAQKEGKVTLYTFSFTGDVGSAMAKAFQDKYGIKVEMVTAVGAMLLERLRSERAAEKFVADTFDGDVVFLVAAKQASMTEPTGYLPVLQSKGGWTLFPTLDKEGHIQALGSTFLTPYVNTGLVTAGEEPKSFQDVLAPKWKGKIVTGTPATDPLLLRMYVLAKRHKVFDDDYFRQLGKQSLKVAANVREADAVLMRGEASLRMLGGASLLNPFIAQGAPVKPLVMEEGTVVQPSRPIALVKNAPHPNAARLFTNWILTAEGQSIFHKVLGSTSVRNDVQDFGPEKGKIMPKKVWNSDPEADLEVARLQREKVMEKLLGLE